MRTLKAGGLCGEGGTGGHRCRRFTFPNTTSTLQVAVLQWCKTVCVFLSVEQCLLLELFSNGVGVYGVDQMLLCARVTVAAMEVYPKGCCSFFTVVCYAQGGTGAEDSLLFVMPTECSW